MVDKHVFPDGKLLWKVDLAGRHDGKPAVVVPVEQLVQPLFHILRCRLDLIEVEQREISAPQLVDSGAILRRQHVHRLTVFQRVKNVHFCFLHIRDYVTVVSDYSIIEVQTFRNGQCF